MPEKLNDTGIAFLRGGGEMGRQVRDYDWTGSALGGISEWPQSLRVAVRLLLSAQGPMVLWWGEALTMLYNDDYGGTIAIGAHPKALGRKCRGRTDAVWRTIGPDIRSVMDGTVTRSTILESSSSHKPHCWEYDLCPVDLMGGVGGVLGIGRPISTEHDVDDRVNRTSSQLLQLYEHSPGFVCVFSGPQHVYEFVNLEYRSLMGERDYIGHNVRNVVPEVAGQGFFELLDRVYETGETYMGDGLSMRYHPSTDNSFTEVKLHLVYKALIAASGEIYGIFVEGTYVPVNAEWIEKPAPRILNGRELQVLGWIALGKTAGETSFILGLSTRTCEAHIYSAARKLDTVNSTQTVVEAIRRGELLL